MLCSVDRAVLLKFFALRYRTVQVVFVFCTFKSVLFDLWPLFSRQECSKPDPEFREAASICPRSFDPIGGEEDQRSEDARRTDGQDECDD